MQDLKGELLPFVGASAPDLTRGAAAENFFKDVFAAQGTFHRGLLDDHREEGEKEIRQSSHRPVFRGAVRSSLEDRMADYGHRALYLRPTFTNKSDRVRVRGLDGAGALGSRGPHLPEELA
ncbi:hypothetical protein GCM10022254_07900 [Actinomadura meridiana]|uniref:Uncharacterized protein n=1 Tax=Actinomadura meridiana TaxID=559626 RepID=A0ABP8BTX4_9ACTN